MQEIDRQYMSQALDLARKGQGRTSPNPCVGAVIVRDNRIVGQGYHRRAGTPHAEIHAIADAGERSAGATLYVTLEPCNHTGKTPPCTQAILRAGIARVVVGMLDPNPNVAGGGCRFLAEKGIAVEYGILEMESRVLNRPFIKHVTRGIPWVAMKAGMSLDAKISPQKGRGGQITGTLSTRMTHQLRDTMDAIMIGVETAITDDPSLTTRLQEKEDARDPLRVILDTRLRLPPAANLLRQESSSPTWIFCGPDAPEENEQRLVRSGAIIHRVRTGGDGRLDLRAVLAFLGKSGITSILVEGGAGIHSSMLRENLVDEVYLFIAPVFIGQQGVSLLSDFTRDPAESGPRLCEVEVRQLGDDALFHGILADT